ncbi:MAG: DUF167 domain-containing protein [Chloroflexi bacterium]|nr:MAG: DUF167 domain-containing protein [Chloroflexota bacterium]
MVISVRVHPRASQARSSWNDGVLDVWVTAPPVDGAANTAVVAAVARHFRVPASRVRLRSGGRSRMKLIEVHKDSPRNV